MAKQYEKPSDLLKQIEPVALHNTEPIPKEIYNRKISEMVTELDGFVETATNARELEMMMRVLFDTKRFVQIGTNSADKNRVILTSAWFFTPVCHVELKHSSNEGDRPFLNLRVVNDNGKAKVRFKLTKHSYTDSVERSVELSVNESKNGSKVEFIILDSGKLEVRIFGVDQTTTNMEIQKVFNVQADRLQNDEQFCEDWYLHFRKMAFGLS